MHLHSISCLSCLSDKESNKQNEDTNEADWQLYDRDGVIEWKYRRKYHKGGRTKWEVEPDEGRSGKGKKNGRKSKETGFHFYLCFD